MLERTWRIAQAVKGIDMVVIATDDERIAEHATAFGAEVQLTSSHWTNGSERTLEAIKLLKLTPEVAINFQGDAVLTPPAVIEKLLHALRGEKNDKFKMATLCTQLTKSQYQNMLDKQKLGAPHGTMVTFALDGTALYFTRALIPFLHKPDFVDGVPIEKAKTIDGETIELFPAHRHIGIYAFRHSALQEYVKLKPTVLEKVEGLEQLRALEHGWPVKVVPVDYQKRTHWSVDYPNDIAIVEKIIQEEGELVK